MLNKQALAAVAAYVALIPNVLADIAHTPPMGFCKEGTCSDDDNGCPAQITTSGDGFPKCAVYDTETVLGDADFEAAEGGGTKVFLDVFEPDKGCAVIVRSPASTDELGCGFNVGTFRNPTCAAIVLQETFMIQHCCGSNNCEEAGAGAKLIRGIDYKRSGLTGHSVTITDKDGNLIEPKQQGYPPQRKRSAPSPAAKANKLTSRGENDDDCKEYVPDGEVYTRPADVTQIVATGVNGGTTGSEVEITEERSVSQSITFSAGINIEIISASTEISFEETLTNGKSKKWTIPAGQSGKVGFTPNLKCTKGALMCDGNESKGEACTGYEEAGEIAGTYAVIATS
ncbi:MAG: hypothetical protein LQ346_003600 [Caloplaca aetnensis]|nr:MAG: hypothetical protein LQ346_003600 [Caloplaca aetnensis]